jgi:hypothetical protein
MAYFTSPPDMVDGQYLSAAQIATYYAQNTNIVWDYARAPTMLQRVLYTGWRGQYPPYSGLIGEWNYGYYNGRIRHKYNFLRYRIIATTSNWEKPHPRIALLLNGAVLKDLEPDLPDVGGGDVTLDGAVVVSPGVAVGQFYDIQLRYSPPVDAWDLDGGIQLVRWYESDSVTGEMIDGDSGSILAFVPPTDFVDGQVITAADLNTNIGDNIDLLYLFSRRAVGSFSVVNEGWAQFCDLLMGYGLYSRTYYRPDHHRLPYLRYGLIVEWDSSLDNPRLDLIVNGVVHDLASLLPHPSGGGLQTITLEGQIDISALPIGDAYLVEFRHSPPYDTANAGSWTEAPGHVALHYLYEADAEDPITPPPGWEAITVPVHLQLVKAGDFNTIMHDLIAINAITSARINPVAGEWRWWESQPSPGWRGNGLVIPHRARWLWYETPPEELEDTWPRLLPIWAQSTSDQAVTLNESKDGMTRFDLDQVPWLAPGMLYRLLDVAFALEDDD